jgi:hypothetical protein
VGQWYAASAFAPFIYGYPRSLQQDGCSRRPASVKFVLLTEWKRFIAGGSYLVPGATMTLARFAHEMARYATCVSFKKAGPPPRIHKPIARRQYGSEPAGSSRTPGMAGRFSDGMPH